ncbi:hypothetical protein ASPSYDRAFT_541191 [Aspergillus sydowii CBS 593.65]|uniref:Uncharacterized protein n=1 Tax=Aspergillus sydowii CBS 593.65 TaxID=1036612 RepID=A0A1L9T0X0_9EURO|nr:uncharacterized protein ASPSYDRAFT_541191 [Aspergillus sydowii CBS 593.65]OJJ53076.1 hypothetical protein ASPSYDRAFT_541191 [Aspergillus sydowii CBS 593.65]
MDVMLWLHLDLVRLSSRLAVFSQRHLFASPCRVSSVSATHPLLPFNQFNPSLSIHWPLSTLYTGDRQGSCDWRNNLCRRRDRGNLAVGRHKISLPFGPTAASAPPPRSIDLHPELSLPPSFRARSIHSAHYYYCCHYYSPASFFVLCAD